jgi:hypothetical protein
MEGINTVKAEFYFGKHYLAEKEIELTSCGEIPDKVQIPFDVDWGTMLLHYRLMGIYLKIPCYEYVYEQGIYDRREQN